MKKFRNEKIPSTFRLFLSSAMDMKFAYHAIGLIDFEFWQSVFLV